MSRIKTRVLGLIFLVLIITAGFSAYADLEPYLTYHGTSSIDGVYTPAGTNFSAYILFTDETILVGNETMLVIGNYSLILNKANSTLNKSKILFYINNYKADQESIYNVANIPTGVELNLTVTLPPTKPSLTSPSDNSNITNPAISFDWTDSTDINGIPTYILQISSLPDFSTIEIVQQVSDSNITLNSSQVLPDNKYYWRAIATDGYNNNLSDIFSFTLDTKLPYLNSSSVLGGVDKNSIIYFSPGDGDSNYNILTIILNASEFVKNSRRIISIRNSTNNEVKFFTQNSFVTSVIKTWDGTISGNSSKYVPDGIYTINASFTDEAGNSNSSIIAAVVVDKTTPVIAFTSNTAQDNSYAQRDWIYVEVSVVEANEENITFYLKNSSGIIINQTVLPAGSRAINFTNLNSDSSYSYYAQALDIVGHSNTHESRTITLDTVPPVISYTAETPANNSFLDSSSIYVKVDITEKNVQDVTFTLYNSSGGIINQTTLPASSRDINFTNLASNTDYSFSASTTDLAGNSVGISSRKITLDNIPPTIDYGPLTSANNSYKNQDWVFIDLIMSDANLLNVQYQIGNGTQGLLTGTLSPGNTSHNFTGLIPNSEYTYMVSARDKAGHFVSTNPRKITLDSTLPQLSQFTSSDRDLISPNTLQQDFTVNLVEKNLAGVTLNGTAMNLLGNNTYSLSTTPALLGCIAEGNCNLAVSSIDLAGNINTISLVLFIDNNAPAITDESALTSEGNAIVYNNDSVYLNASINESLTQISYVWLEGNWTGAMQNFSLENIGNGKYYHLADKNLLENGEHVSWRYFANDSAGNIGAGNLNTLIITNRNPQFNGTVQNFQFIEDGNEQNLSLFNYFSDSDLPDDAITFTPNTLSGFNGFQGKWIITQAGILTIKPDMNFNGTVNIVLTATDKFGLNVNSNPFIINVTGTNEVPLKTSDIPDITIAEDNFNNSIDLDDYFRDDDGTIARYTVTKYDDAENVSITIDSVSHIVNITPQPNWNGVGKIYFTAVDNNEGIGNSNLIAITVTPVNDAPAISGIPTQQITEDYPAQFVELKNYTSDIESPSNNLSYYSIKQNSSQVSCVITSDKKLQYTPASNWFGIAECAVRASDGELNSSDFIVKINVSNVPDKPIITSTPITTATQGQLYEYKIIVEDGDSWAGESFTYTLLKTPQSSDEEFGQMVIDNAGKIIWVPTDAAARFENEFNPIIVKVTDSSGLSANQSWNINVQDVNDPPRRFNLKNPENNQQIVNSFVDLQWDETSDSESPGEQITYKVYHSDNSSNIKQVATLAGEKNTTYRIINLENNKTYYWYVVAVDGGQAERRSNEIFQYNTMLKPLVINNIGYEINGIESSKLKVKPGDNLRFKLNVRNLYESLKIEDITAQITIEEIDQDNDLEQETDEFDLNPLTSKDLDIEFKIPLLVDEDEYAVKIILEGKDENGNVQTATLELKLEVDKDSHAVAINSVKLSPETSTSKGQINISVNLINTGRNDAAVNISAENIALGINVKSHGIIIENFESITETLSDINIPSNIKPDSYPITVKVYFANGVFIGEKTVNLQIQNRVPVISAQLSQIEWNEDTAKEIDLKNYFSDPDEHPLTFVLSKPAEIDFSLSNGVNGVVTFNPKKDFNGTALINITASDGFNATSITNVKLVVKNTNDLPKIKSYSPQVEKLVLAERIDSAEFSAEAEDIDNGDIVTLQWKLNSSDSIGIGKSVTFTNLERGAYNLTLKVSDHEGTGDSRSWLIIVSHRPVSSQYSGSFQTIPDDKLQSAQNLTITHQNFGGVDFGNSEINLTGAVDFDNYVLIKHGAFGIDTNKYPQLNKPARITLKELGFTGEPTIYFNKGFGINGSNECPKDICTNRVYDASAGTLSFDVPHFSTYFVNAGNNAPIANASSDIETETGLLAALDGSKSKDINGDSLNYSWTQVSGPSVSLSSNKVVNPTFTPTQAGNHTFQLIVNDGNLDSAPDTVTVSVKQSTLGGALDITRIRLTSDGKDSELKPGEQLKVKIDLKNKGSVDIRDITLKVEFKDSAGKILEDDDGDDVEDESEFDLDAGDDEGDLNKDDITFTFNMPFDVDNNDEYFVYVTAEGTADNDSSIVFKDIDTSEKIEFSRESHEITIVRAELNPMNVKCDRRTTASISIRNIGRDEEEGKISIENPTLGISQSEEFTLDNDASDNGNLLRKQFSFRIADNAEPGTYSIPLTVTFADGRETESKDLQLTVEGCEKKVVEKKPLIEEVSVNIIPATPPTTIKPIREAIKKKPMTVDFRDSNEYMMILGFTILMVVILIIGMLTFWAVSNGRKRRR